MPELGFQEQQTSSSSLRSGYSRARDASPDSVIFTLESNFSLFSSASASVDRCSFTSDVHDHDSFASDFSLNLVAVDDREHHESWVGPDPDPNKPTTVQNNKHHNNTTRLSTKPKVIVCFNNKSVSVVKEREDNSESYIEDHNHLLDSARNSFSLSLKECQDRRSRSEALLSKLERRRPASIDLNNVTSSSPRLGAMKKSSVSSRKSGTFPSPGTPNYRHTGVVSMQKGWSSERVPLHNSNNGMRRQVNGAALLPFNNGRTLPSKWEDAERWIFSPVSGDGVVRPSFAAPQRRPKSKSGPLGPPGVAYYSLYSPAMPMFDGGNVGNFMPGSPFSAGIMAADGLAIRSGGSAGAFPARAEPCIARSASVHGCSENPPSLPSQDENFDGIKDDISGAVSRRDMATQMSPEGSTHSSPKRSSFSASTPTALPIVELQSVRSSRSEVRDVQVDERVTVTRWSKKHRARNPGKSSEIVDDWRKQDVHARSSPWDISEAAKGISKSKREEAKIIAWENLQKAKAEAAIRKLEMKLEKKRSSSMDKIMNKLRLAQRRAQDMRNSVLANQGDQGVRTSHNSVSFRRTRRMRSLSGCFTCHAF
ncbi:Remorin_C domain-containing protein [Cephalotus follicularis]|uniref:Remorin_C domain-containing protein n=1 Tax=Cephalotus follicularis TaxID=3775 RepID=A0A1Q3BX95_CEPFO|nr:Remorin_C domain-containing protein [Cephalotus follicularis]